MFYVLGILLICCLPIITSPSYPSLLDVPTPLTPYKKQYINLLSENDAYVYPADRYYSAGNRLSYTSKEYNFGVRLTRTLGWLGVVI